MNKRIISIMVLFSILMMGGIVTLGATETVAIYVDTNGNDSNQGTLNSPLASLEAARDKTRTINNGQRDIIIYLRGGTYNRSKTFLLDEKDSGKNGKTITYCPYNDEKVSITGGVSIPSDSFGEVTDTAILDRFSSNASKLIKQIDLKKFGIKEFPTPTLTASVGILPWMTKEPNNAELFFNDQAMTIARWPNNDEWAIVESISDAGAHPRLWMDDEKEGGNWVSPEKRDKTHGFKMGYSDARVEKWVSEKNAMMWGFWWYEWYDQIVRIKEIDTKTKSIVSEQPSLYMAKAGTKYYAFNILSELDMPGEYYVDIDTGILYFYPPSELSSSSIGYSVMTDPLVSIVGAQNIKFMDLTFELTRGATIISDNKSQNNLIYGCTIRNTASDAINMSGKNNGVKYCTIYNVNGGVTLNGGNRETLERGDNYVENCHIYSFARISQTYTNAFALHGVGNRASNNKMHNALHQAVSFTGNDHVIENNEIFDVLLNTDDAGAIYTGRNFAMRGTVIKNNYIHNLGVHSLENKFTAEHKATSTGAIGIYLDDGFAGVTIENNILYKCDTGIFINGGRNNTVIGNILLNVSAPIFTTDIAFDSSGDGTWANNGFGLYKPGTTDPIVPFRETLYSKYPNMNDIESDTPRQPKYNIIEKNLASASKLISSSYRVITDGIFNSLNTVETSPAMIIKESDFKNVAKGDLTPNESLYSAVKEIKGINFSEIGLKPRPEDTVIETIEINKVSAINDLTKTDLSGDEIINLFVGSAKAIVNGENTYVDRKNTSVMPIIINEKTMIPVRFVAEGFGATVNWIETKSKAEIIVGDTTIHIIVGEKQMMKNNEIVILEQEAMKINERVYIPLRSLNDALGKQLYWDDRGLIILSNGPINVKGLGLEIDKMINKMK